MMMGEEEWKKKGASCVCMPKTKAEYVIKEDQLCGDYITPIRISVKVGEEVVQVEEWIQWSV
jgi:hypothetical protein